MNIPDELRRIAALGDQHAAGRAANGYVNVPQLLRDGQLVVDHYTATGEGQGELFIKGRNIWIGMRVWQVDGQVLTWSLTDYSMLPDSAHGVIDTSDAVLSIVSGNDPMDCLQAFFSPHKARSTPLGKVALKLRDLARNGATLMRFDQMAQGRGKSRLVRFSSTERDRGAKLYEAMGFAPQAAPNGKKIWTKVVGYI